MNNEKQPIYTMQQWHEDRILNVQVGQLIHPDVFFQLLNGVPPQTYSDGIFQMGEPHSHETTTGRPLYMTFEQEKGQYYRYVGLKP